MALSVQPQRPFSADPAKFRCGAEKGFPEPNRAPAAKFKGLLLWTETKLGGVDVTFWVKKLAGKFFPRQ